MRKTVFLLLAVAFMSCSENEQASRELHVYFDLDSLLDQQIEQLSAGRYTVSKTVIMDGKEERQSHVFDSAGWESEFIIIRDFDLNKPYNVGAYTVDQEEGVQSYRLADQTLDAPVKYFDVERGADGLKITSEYYEDKSIYQHRRKLSLQFHNNLLLSYEVKGFQKMIMKDTIHYRISGEVKINE